MKTYSLHEVNEFIRRILALNLPEALWIRCEISQVNEARGHYFLELVQKAEESDEVIAQAAAVIWQRSFRQLRSKLGLLVKDLLQDGMEIQVKARIDFNERYGLKFTIEDIDPAYTLGKIEMRRQQTIEGLRQANLLGKNAELSLPMVLQRIAVISSERAAGYQDFLKHLQQNSYGYQFHTQLFPSAMQGDRVEPEMLQQLKNVERRHGHFDCIVIIRGGGARLDLAAFDGAPLCEAIAQCTLPVLTGIGHDVDETVLDLVAHTSLKTPTAVADFIVNRSLLFENVLANYARRLKVYSTQEVKSQTSQLKILQQKMLFTSQQYTREAARMLEYIQIEIPKSVKYQLESARKELHQLEKITKLLSIESTLRRGFTTTAQGGKLLHTKQEAEAGKRITTRFSDGEINSTVE